MVNSDTAETLLSNGYVNEKYTLGCTALCLQQEALVLVFTLMARGMTTSVGTLIATRLAESRATRNTGQNRIQPVLGAILCKGITGKTPSAGIQALHDVQVSLPDQGIGQYMHLFTDALKPPLAGTGAAAGLAYISQPQIKIKKALGSTQHPRLQHLRDFFLSEKLYATMLINFATMGHQCPTIADNVLLRAEWGDLATDVRKLPLTLAHEIGRAS